MDAETELRIREKAYRLWEDEGRPDGCAERHWQQAMVELAAIGDPNKAAKKPARARKKPEPAA